MTTGLRSSFAGALCAAAILYAQSRPATFKPCVQALQKLEVPAQIHLVRMCQISPETRPILTPLLSENGIDVYRLEYPQRSGGGSLRGQRGSQNAAPQARYPFSVTALAVFQDEGTRENQLKAFMDMYPPGRESTQIPFAGVSWFGGYDTADSGYQQDWGSIVSFKYETIEFLWLNKKDVLLRNIGLYAPLGCITHIAPKQPNFSCGSPDIESTEIGEYSNPSPPPLNHGLFLYKVATMLAEGRRPAQNPQ
jgi:hypothetical protein